jgi:hypothetical protein
VVGF